MRNHLRRPDLWPTRWPSDPRALARAVADVDNRALYPGRTEADYATLLAAYDKRHERKLRRLGETDLHHRWGVLMNWWGAQRGLTRVTDILVAHEEWILRDCASRERQLQEGTVVRYHSKRGLELWPIYKEDNLHGTA